MADLEEDVVFEETQALLEKGIPPLDIIASLQAGMTIVGKRFEEKEYFLSELILSSEIFNDASKLLGDLESTSDSKHGTFLLGTIYGDIHDIGKNIVATVMSSNGFKVIDIGVDVATEAFIEAIKQHNPQVVGISCLLTTAFDNMKECIQSIENAGLRKDIKILIGGGPCDETTCKYVNADRVCKNPQESVEFCRNIMGVN